MTTPTPEPTMDDIELPPEPVAWQYRERSPDPDDNNEWSPWREVRPGDLEMRRKLVAARPDRRELRPLYTRPTPAPETRDVLLQAIQRLNQNPYSLTKRECIHVLEELRSELSTSPAPTQATQDAEQAAMWLHGHGALPRMPA